MADEQPEPEQVQPQVQVLSSPDTQVIYSNYTAVTAAPEEFIMRFCIRNVDDPATAMETIRVFLTLAHAKRLVLAMARSVKAYEDLFGEIPIEPTEHLTEEGRARLGIKPLTEKPK